MPTDNELLQQIDADLAVTAIDDATKDLLDFYAAGGTEELAIASGKVTPVEWFMHEPPTK